MTISYINSWCFVILGPEKMTEFLFSSSSRSSSVGFFDDFAIRRDSTLSSNVSGSLCGGDVFDNDTRVDYWVGRKSGMLSNNERRGLFELSQR